MPQEASMSSAPLHFRRARGADLDAIVGLLADDILGSGREDPSVPASPCYVAAFEAIERDANQLLAVAERDGAVVGCLRSEEHTSELQSRENLVCRLLLEKKNTSRIFHCD